MYLVYGLALHGFSVAQVDRAPARVWEVIDSNPVGDSDFFFVRILSETQTFSLSHVRDMLIILFSQLKKLKE